VLAINHDPERFERPHELIPDRSNAASHITFIRGIHTCLGQSLARAEARIGLERILDRMGDIEIDPGYHGPKHDRHYDYDPTFLLRGLLGLHLKYSSLDN
jgi:cytochrome P450